MKMLHELMKMKEKKGKSSLSEPYKKAKMSALKDLESLASQMMAEPLKGAKKVEVAAPDNEGLKAGLEHAKEMLAKGGEVDPDSEESDGSAQEMADKALYDHKAGEEQKLDGEESEEDQHEDRLEDEGLSDDELEAKIQQLMKLKQMKMKK